MSNTIWWVELYCDVALAQEISAKFGSGQQRPSIKYSSGNWIISQYLHWQKEKVGVSKLKCCLHRQKRTT